MSYRWLWILLPALAALALSRPARADCASECAYAYGGYGTYNYTTCYQLKCTSRQSVFYGAIAYGATSDAYGYAYDKASAGEANQVAMANCRQHGKDCQLVASFSNSCRAVAAVESKNRFVTGQGADKNTAQNTAMSACRSQIGGKCEIEVWTCAKP